MSFKDLCSEAQYPAFGIIVKTIESYEMGPGWMKQVTRSGMLATVSGLNSLPCGLVSHE